MEQGILLSSRLCEPIEGDIEQLLRAASQGRCLCDPREFHEPSEGDGDHGLVSELFRIAADDRFMLLDEPAEADDGALVLDRAFR